jgi:hypothetical protein
MKFDFRVFYRGEPRCFQIEAENRENAFELVQIEVLKTVKTFYSEYCEMQGISYNDNLADEEAQKAINEMRFELR